MCFVGTCWDVFWSLEWLMGNMGLFGRFNLGSFSLVVDLDCYLVSLG